MLLPKAAPVAEHRRARVTEEQRVGVDRAPTRRPGLGDDGVLIRSLTYCKKPGG